MTRSDERKLPLIILTGYRPLLDNGFVIVFIVDPSIAFFRNIFLQFIATLELELICDVPILYDVRA